MINSNSNLNLAPRQGVPAQSHLGPIARMAAARGTGASVSYEFFPPKTDKMEKALWQTLRRLEPLGPEFFSVTYGAGGSTRERTLKTVAKIAEDSAVPPAGHLTCVGASRAEIDQIAREFWQAGVRHIVALRGDPQAGIGEAYQPQKGGYAYSSDLVAGLKKVADFEISVSAYPERHPESANWQVEIDNLKRKVDAGASRAITQFFFTPDIFLSFQERARAAGITIPIVPGVMLQPNFKGLRRMADMCGVDVPNWYADLFDGLDDDAPMRERLTTSLALEMTASLYEQGVRDFHLYTLNRADLACAAARILGQRSA